MRLPATQWSAITVDKEVGNGVNYAEYFSLVSKALSVELQTDIGELISMANIFNRQDGQEFGRPNGGPAYRVTIRRQNTYRKFIVRPHGNNNDIPLSINLLWGKLESISAALEQVS